MAVRSFVFWYSDLQLCCCCCSKVEDWRSGAVRISVYVWQVGQTFFVACPGESYSYMQTEIRRFENSPSCLLLGREQHLIRLTPIDCCAGQAYQQRCERHGDGLYQWKPQSGLPAANSRSSSKQLSASDCCSRCGGSRPCGGHCGRANQQVVVRIAS